MGLDLRISEVQNSTTDEQGRTVTTTVELTNLRGCYRILDKLGERLESGGLDNCATYTFYDITFQAILEELIKDRQMYLDGKAYRFPSDTDEQFNNRVQENIKELDDNIEALEEFIAKEEIPEIEEDQRDEDGNIDESYGDREFEVHAWW